jgi:hypothetical protein
LKLELGDSNPSNAEEIEVDSELLNAVATLAIFAGGQVIEGKGGYVERFVEAEGGMWCWRGSESRILNMEVYACSLL